MAGEFDDAKSYGSLPQPSTTSKEQSSRFGMMLKPIFTDSGYLYLFLSVPMLAVRWHWVAITCAIFSATICWLMGYAEYSVVDPMIFKSIYVVFGFALGFRNVRANARYGEALNHTKSLFGVSWSVITLFRESKARQKVEQAFVGLLRAIAEHMHAISHRSDSSYGLAGLRPSHPKGASSDDLWGYDMPDEVEVLIAPRSLMVSVFVMAGNEICMLEHAPLQERKRSLWMLRHKFFNAYEEIELLTLPSVTRAFWTLITNVLFVFGVALPWGISVSGHTQGLHDRKVHEHKFLDLFSAVGFKSLLFILSNTLMCMIVLFGLNALAHENEQPFKGVTASAGETIHLRELVDRFEDAVKSYEKQRDATGKLVGKQFSKEQFLSSDAEGEAAFLDNEEQALLCGKKYKGQSLCA